MLSPKLAPEIRALLEGMAAQGAPPLETLPVSQARQAAHGMSMLAGAPEPVARIENRKIPGRGGEIPVRLYVPEGNGPFPGVVYLHGGGWVICDLDTHDNICRAIASRGEAIVVAVDYRLAPEHKFPAALEDSFDAVRWTASNAAALGIDPRRLTVAGDSAGANMATVIACKARDEGGPAIARQVMVYPVTDLTRAETPSHREFATEHFLTRAVMEWFGGHYFARPEDRLNPDASPAFIANLAGLPRAIVITAECDPLRDEGEAYARRLEAAGVPVTLTRYEGMIHPFLNFLGVTASAHKAVTQIADAVREP